MSLQELMAEANKTYSNIAIVKANATPGVRHIPSGILNLDIALFGGIPEGMVTTIYGPPAGGKTTQCILFAKEVLKKYPNKSVLYIDAENTFDTNWAEALGLDLNRVYLSQPETAEEAVVIAEKALVQPDLAMLIVDSLPALAPTAEIETSIEDHLMAKRAQLIGRMCTKFYSALKNARRAHEQAPCVIWVNQYRANFKMFGGDHTIPGGIQPRFMASIELDCKRAKQAVTKVNDDNFGEVSTLNEHTISIKKSKIGKFMDKCDYQLSVSDMGDYPKGKVIEHEILFKHMKKLGLIGGKRGALTIDNVEAEFRVEDEIKEFFSVCPDEVLLPFKRKLIAYARKINRISPIPKDGYLLGKLTKEEVKDIEAFVNSRYASRTENKQNVEPINEEVEAPSPEAKQRTRKRTR